MKLTEPMKTALRKLNAGHSSPGDFRTLEALRRRGLAERYTSHIIKAEYVTKDGSTLQFREPSRKPYLRHDWYWTNDGLDAER